MVCSAGRLDFKTLSPEQALDRCHDIQPAGTYGTQPAVCVRVENTGLYQLYITGNRNKQDYICISVKMLLMWHTKVLKR